MTALRFALALGLVAAFAMSISSAQEQGPPASPPPLKLDDLTPPVPPAPPTPPSAPASPLPLTPPSAPSTLNPALPAGATPPAAATPPVTGTVAPAAPTTPGTAPATITIQVPANASLWFAEQKMTQTGTTRTFRSPPLDTTKSYMYKVKVSWPAGPGQKDYSSEHEITVKGGQTTIIDFTPLARGPAVTGQPPAGYVPDAQPQPTPRWQLPNIFRNTSGSRP